MRLMLIAKPSEHGCYLRRGLSDVEGCTPPSSWLSILRSLLDIRYIYFRRGLFRTAGQ
jgi:hypothetical protein